MFGEHGYERTTVQHIASAAGVTERTFFRYFRSKEDLVLGEVLELLPVMRQAILARPIEEAPYEAVCNALLAIASTRDAGFAILFSGPPARFLSRPTRVARPVLFEFENGIAEALIERLGAESGDDHAVIELRASVLARASVAALRSTTIAYAALPERDKTLAEAVRLVRRAFAFLKSPE